MEPVGAAEAEDLRPRYFAVFTTWGSVMDENSKGANIPKIVPHTYGGFNAVFMLTHGRKPTPQEIFDAGMRGGRDILWPHPPPVMTEEKFVAIFEEIIFEDPEAYRRAGEGVYEVTKKELGVLFLRIVGKS